MNTPDQQREVLEALWTQLHGGTDPQWCQYYDEVEVRHEARYFLAMLDCGAFVDAALMLLPEGWGWSAHAPSVPEPDNPPSARIWAGGKGVFEASGNTPALALCAAIESIER